MGDAGLDPTPLDRLLWAAQKGTLDDVKKVGAWALVLMADILTVMPQIHAVPPGTEQPRRRVSSKVVTHFPGIINHKGGPESVTALITAAKDGRRTVVEFLIQVCVRACVCT